MASMCRVARPGRAVLRQTVRLPRLQVAAGAKAQLAITSRAARYEPFLWVQVVANDLLFSIARAAGTGAE
jgi:hypothetical protein